MTDAGPGSAATGVARGPIWDATIRVSLIKRLPE